MNGVINSLRDYVRGIMRTIARQLNTLTGGKLHPDVVTLIGLIMHAPIAWLIATGHFGWAAVLLVIFGLFDTLDGELARLQHRASEKGMLLDASTDRMKEVLLYTGAAYFLALGDHPAQSAWAVVACGASLCVSYVKAKGEAAVASKNIPHAQLNKMFQDGLARFEIRMVILLAGLLTGYLIIAIGLIAILSTYTAIQRLALITRRL